MWNANLSMGKLHSKDIQAVVACGSMLQICYTQPFSTLILSEGPVVRARGMSRSDQNHCQIQRPPRRLKAGRQIRAGCSWPHAAVDRWPHPARCFPCRLPRPIPSVAVPTQYTPQGARAPEARCNACTRAQVSHELCGEPGADAACCSVHHRALHCPQHHARAAYGFGS